MFNLFIRVVDPNPDQDPPDPDPLVEGMNSDSDRALDPDPDPSIVILKKYINTFIPTSFYSFGFFIFEK